MNIWSKTYPFIIRCRNKRIEGKCLIHVQSFVAVSFSGVELHSEVWPTRCSVMQFLLSVNCSTCFGWIPHPSSWAQHCTYSIWYLSNSYYRGRVFNFSTIAVGSSNSLTNTRCCRYSVVLLMMGGWIHPKHVEQFTEIQNCVTLHLVGHTLEFIYDAWNPKRQTLRPSLSPKWFTISCSLLTSYKRLSPLQPGTTHAHFVFHHIISLKFLAPNSRCQFLHFMKLCSTFFF